MRILFWITTLSVLHASLGDIILSVNLDDVETLLDNLISPQTVENVRKFWRRTFHTFKKELQAPARRSGADDADTKDYNLDKKVADKLVKELISMGENATRYIKTVKNVFVAPSY